MYIKDKNKKELSLQDIQKEALNILIKIDEICRKLDIKYYLAYGTLLGAIRHEGFIPWDDDIDIMMHRKDLIALKNYFNHNAKYLYPLKYCDRENTINYEYYIPRISNDNFEYCTEIKNKKNIKIGVFIDIYPIDNYGNNVDECQKLHNTMIRINNKYHRYINGQSYTSKYRSFFKLLYHYFLRVTHINYENKVNKKIDNIILENNKRKTAFVGIPTWEPYCNPIKQEYFKETIECKFENHLFYIPKEYDNILKQQYGDYMKLPPIEERKPHHFYKIYQK